MKILVVGSGGREHAIIRKLKESPKAEEIYCAPGNGGISFDAVCVNIAAMDIEGIVKFAKEKSIDLVFVAPDDPLAAGMVDKLNEAGIDTFGPIKAAAEIESSKVFAKSLMKKYEIPTAKYEVFSTAEKAMEYLQKTAYPVVIKADGLALGKGVFICKTKEEAKDAVVSIMEEKVFGESGSQIVVEEFLQGPEVSVLAFTDGKTLKPMVSSQDHKRAFDGNLGPNTGGMGTISPNPFYTKEIEERCMREIFLPTVKAMQKEGRPFKGCLYFGLMLTKDGPKVIEYNSRFGDPETQVVLPRLKTDFLDILLAVVEERLDTQPILWDNRAAACVVIASGGYPVSYKKGYEITGLNNCGQIDGATIYHSGTCFNENKKLITCGGRVLGVTALADTLEEALAKAYSAAEKIHFSKAFYRKDIGLSAIKK